MKIEYKTIEYHLHACSVFVGFAGGGRGGGR